MFVTGAKRVIMDKDSVYSKYADYKGISLYEINFMEGKWNPCLHWQGI